MASEYGVQINTTINGDLVNLRGTDGAELAEVIDSVAQNADDIFTKLGDIKQAGLAKGVFSGNVNPTPTTGAPKAASASSSGPGGAPPTCAHGAMKDQAGKRNKKGEPYKNRYYCVKFGSDCEAQGNWVEA